MPLQLLAVLRPFDVGVLLRSSSVTELSSSFSLSEESLSAVRVPENVREGVRGVRRRTSLRLERPDPDVTADSGVRRVDVADLVGVLVGVVGPECESPRSEFEAELLRESEAGITLVPITVDEYG